MAGARRRSRRSRAQAGFTLRERLTLYPEYVRAWLADGAPWVDPRIADHVRALADPETGLADPGARPAGRPWQEPDGGLGGGPEGEPGAGLGSGRVDLYLEVDTTGRTSDRRSDFDSVYGDWSEVAAHARTTGAPTAAVLDADTKIGLDLAATDPGALLDPAREAAAMALFTADGAALDTLVSIADSLRRDAVGDDVTYVVNRNINFTNVCYVGCRFCAFAQRERDADAYRLSMDQVADRAEQAWSDGAPPRSACRAASIRRCPARRTQTWSGR